MSGSPALLASLLFGWSFPALECAPSEDGLADVVKIVHWRLRGETPEGVAAERYGTFNLSPADPTAFTPFDQLTPATVQAWCEAALEVDGYKQSIADEIDLLLNPPLVSKTLPEGPAAPAG